MRDAPEFTLRGVSLFHPGMGYYRRMASLTFDTVDPTTLNLSDRNPRKGDVPAIKASLRANDVYAPITVNRGTLTGRPMEILAGNHTCMAFRELSAEQPDDPRWRKIPIALVDVDDACAERILGGDNKFGLLGGFDEEQLAALVGGYDTEFALAIGFTEAEQASLAALIAPPAELDGLTEPEPEPQPEPATDDDMGTPTGPADKPLTLKFPPVQHDWVLEGLTGVADSEGLERVSDALLFLLSKYYGDEPPSPDA